MNKEDLQYIRKQINTIDSLSIDIMEMIVDYQRDENVFQEGTSVMALENLAEALEDVTNAVTEFQEQQKWI